MNNKNSNWKWNALAIVAVAATAATASAQDIALKATVPFAFSINRANLAPGNYTVTRDRNVWVFRSDDAHQSALIVNAVGIKGETAQTAALTFDCLGRHCQLRVIRVGGGELGAEVPAPKLSKSAAAEVAVVNVPLERNRVE